MDSGTFSLEVGPMFPEAQALGHLVNGYVFERVFYVP
jgi:hypothetical protein